MRKNANSSQRITRKILSRRLTQSLGLLCCLITAPVNAVFVYAGTHNLPYKPSDVKAHSGVATDIIRVPTSGTYGGNNDGVYAYIFGNGTPQIVIKPNSGINNCACIAFLDGASQNLLITDRSAEKAYYYSYDGNFLGYLGTAAGGDGIPGIEGIAVTNYGGSERILLAQPPSSLWLYPSWNGARTSINPPFNHNPVMISGMNNGFIVTYVNTKKIQKYSPFGIETTNITDSLSPIGVSAGDNDYYAVGFAEHAVKIYSPTDTHVQTIGIPNSPGADNTRFNYPMGLSFQYGTLLVADHLNSRIQRFFDPALWLTPASLGFYELNLGVQNLTLGNGYHLTLHNAPGILTMGNHTLGSAGDANLTVQSGGSITVQGTATIHGRLNLSASGTFNVLNVGVPGFTVSEVNCYSGSTLSVQQMPNMNAFFTINPGSTVNIAGTVGGVFVIEDSLGAYFPHLDSGIQQNPIRPKLNVTTRVGRMTGAGGYTNSGGHSSGIIELVGGSSSASNFGILSMVPGTVRLANTNGGHSATVTGVSGSGLADTNITLDIASGSTLTINPNANYSYPGRIMGSGNLVIGGTYTQTILSTVNLNSLAINSGGIVFNNDLTTANLEGAGGSLTLDTNVNMYIGSSGVNRTFAGSLNASNARVYKNGSGTQKFTGTSSFLILDIQAGTVEFATNNHTITNLSGAAAGNLHVNGITVTTGGVNDYTFSGKVYGSGTFKKTGSGKLTLDGAGNSIGRLEVTAGTLELSTPFTIATLDGTGGTLQLNSGSGITVIDGTYSGTVSGVAGITKNGTNSTLTLNGTTSYTGLTKVNAGTVNITSLNGSAEVGDGINSSLLTVTGATNLTNATLTLNTNSNFSTNTWSMNNGVLDAKIDVSFANAISLLAGNNTFKPASNKTITISGVISNSGALTQDGPGTLTLSGANTYQGLTTVNQGTMNLSGTGLNNATVSNGATLTLVNADIFKATSVLDISGTLNIGFNQTIGSLKGNSTGIVNLQGKTLTLKSAGTGTFTGTLSGSNNVNSKVVLDSGVVTLAGTNEFETLEIINNGEAILNTGVTFTVPKLLLNSGTFTDNVGGTFSGVTLTSASNYFKVGSGKTTTLTNLSGAGGFTANGLGILKLSGASTYTGATKVSSGTLQGDTNSVVTDITNDATVAFVQTTDGTYNKVISETSNVTPGSVTIDVASTKTLTFSGANLYTGSTTIIGSGTVKTGLATTFGNSNSISIGNNATLDLNNITQTLNNVGGVGTVALGSATLTNTVTGTVSQTGDIGGTGNVQKAGAGTWDWGTTAKNFTGTLTVSAGTLRGNTTALGGRNVTNNGTVEFNQAVSGSYSNAITGGLVHKSGAGVLTLSSAGSTVNALTIAVGAGGVTLTGNHTIGNISAATSGLTVNGATLTIGNTTDYAFGGVSGTGNLVVQNGVLTASANTYTGTTSVTGGTLKTSHANALSNSSGVTVNAGATLDLNNITQTLNNVSGAGTVALGSATLTNTVTGTVSQTGDISGAGNVQKAGTGIWDWGTTAKSFTGTLTVSAGTLKGDAAALGGRNVTNTGTIEFNQAVVGSYSNTITGGLVHKSGAGALTLSSAGSTVNALTIAGGAGGVTLTGNHTIGNISGAASGLTVNGATLTIGDTTNYAFGGVSGTGNLVVQNGVLTASANTYTGTTGVTGGTLKTSHANALSNSSAVTVNAVATLDLNNITQTLNNVGGAGTVALGSATLTNTVTGTVSQTGDIGGTGNVQKAGTGIWDWGTTAKSFTGTLTVSAGTLRGNATALGGRNVTNTGTVEFNQAIIGSYSNTITGGLVHKSGAGVLTLSSAGSHVNALTIAGGAGGVTLTGNHTIGNISGAASGLTVNGATLTIGDTTNYAFGGVSGTGNLVVQNGVLTASANTYTGITSVTGGALKTSHANALSNSSGVTVNAGATLDLNNITQTLNNVGGVGTVALGSATLTNTVTGTVSQTGDIGGTGNVQKAGTGIWDWGTTAKSFTGTLTVSAGTLKGDATALGGRNVTNTGTVEFNQAVVGSYSNTITGGLVHKSGAGVLTLSSAGSTVNALTIAGGAGGVTLTGNHTIGNISGAASGLTVNGATLTIGDTTNYAFGGVSGTGNLVVQNGVLTASANTYTGTTGVNGGTLRMNSVNAFSNSVAFQVALGARLELNNFSQQFNDLTGAGVVDLGTNTSTVLTHIVNTNSIYTGAISGKGNIKKLGNNTWEVSGANTYEGNTMIEAGVLKTNHLNAIQSSRQVTVLAGATLDMNGITQNVKNLNGAGHVVIGANNNLLHGLIKLINTVTQDETWSGVISGNGDFVKDGPMTATLSGINTYTGLTEVWNGTLKLGINNTLPNTTTLILSPNTVFDLNGYNQSITELNGSGTISLSTGILSVIRGQSDALITGNGGLITDGPLLLSGINTIGSLNVLSDTVTLDTAPKTIQVLTGDGNIEVNGIVATVGNHTNFSFNGNLSGDAGAHLSKTGSGVFTLESAQGYLGSVGVQTGALKLGIEDALIDSANMTLAFGTTLDMTSNNQTLKQLSGQGTVLLGGKTLTQVVPAGVSTYSGNIIGTNAAAAVIKEGTGTWVITGTNQYLGGTYVNEGILQGNTNSLKGNIHVAQNSQLVFDQSMNGLYSGNISGQGMLVKNNVGNLQITGHSTIQGGTRVQAGTLSVLGTLTSDVMIDPNGTLGGWGKIVGNVSNSGTFAVGGSTSSLKIENGDYISTSPNSVFKVMIGPAMPGAFSGPCSKLTIQNGILNAGGILEVYAEPGNYKEGLWYDFIDATAIQGTFNIGTPFVGPYKLVLDAQADKIYLGVKQLPFGSLVMQGLSGNAAVLGNYFAQLPNLPIESDLGNIYGILTVGLTGLHNELTLEVEKALESISPGRLNAMSVVVQDVSMMINQFNATQLFNFREMGNALPASNVDPGKSLRNSMRFLNNITRWEYLSHPDIVNALPQQKVALLKGIDNKFTTWLQGFNLAGDQKVSQNNPGFHAKTGGMMAGLDYAPKPEKMVGFGIGFFKNWIQTKFAFDSEPGSGVVSNRFATVYGTTQYNKWFLDGSFTAVLSKYDFQQHFLFGPINRKSHGQHGGATLVPHIGLGYTTDVYDIQYSPFISVDYVYHTEKAYTMRGAGAIDQNIQAKTSTVLKTTLGIKIAKVFEFDHSRWSPMLFLNGNHRTFCKGNNITASLINQPNTFTVSNFAKDGVRANPGLGLLVEWTPDLSIQANLESQFGGGYRGYEVKLALRSRF